MIGFGLAQHPRLIPKSMKGDAQPGSAPPAGKSQLCTEGLQRCAGGVRKHRLGIELGLAIGSCWDWLYVEIFDQIGPCGGGRAQECISGTVKITQKPRLLLIQWVWGCAK